MSRVTLKEMLKVLQIGKKNKEDIRLKSGSTGKKWTAPEMELSE